MDYKKDLYERFTSRKLWIAISAIIGAWNVPGSIHDRLMTIASIVIGYFFANVLEKKS